jgi:serine/arginine repetitive matrix protein 2
MPSLAGFFSRKNKSSSRSKSDTPTTSVYSNGTTDFDSAQSSPTAEYVTPGRSLPSSPNGQSSLHPNSARGEQASSVYPSLAAPSNKLRLPFTRKKASAAASSTSIATTSHGSNFGTPPRPSYMGRESTSTASDGEAADFRRLRPPPSKSAIFAAYGDPHSALSTRSLPTERPAPIQTSPIPPPVPPKKASFFHWSKSTPSSPQNTFRKPKPRKDEAITPPSDSSFNLKSFRHVMPPSPNASDLSLPAPIPRPRGTSTTSESSQRISVAAFREAQARRSTADSPVPSHRAPSPLSPQLSNNYVGETSRARPGPRPQQSLSTPVSQGSRQPPQKHRTSGLAYTSDSEESSSSEEGESDDSDRPTNGIVRRKRTITKNNGTDMSVTREPVKMRATKSEVGHGSSSYHSPSSTRRDFVPAPRSQSSHILMSQFSGSGGQNGSVPSDDPAPRSQSSLGFNANGSRTRASVSTSALSPSAAAKRASIVVAANSGPGE